MFTSRLLTVGFILSAFLYTTSAASAQNPPPGLEDAKHMAKLLEKAEEEYRQYFRKPTTAPQYWAAMQFEMELGKFDLAAMFLKQLLALEPKDKVDQELVVIEQAKGLSEFTRLQAVKKWTDYAPFEKEAQDNVKLLIGRLTTALNKHLSDGNRLKKFIGNLAAKTREERAYAFLQLQRSGPYAVAYLIEALRENRGKDLHDKIVGAMLRLPKDIVPAFLEMFAADFADPADARRAELRLTLLDIVHRRGDRRVVPYLWHMSESTLYPLEVRQKAKKMLASFLNTKEQNLPPAKVELVELAEQYFLQKVRFPDEDQVTVWPRSGEKISIKPVAFDPRRAEFFYGKRFAEQALDLDPQFGRANRVFLNFLLDRDLQPTLDQKAYSPISDYVRHLLLQVNTDFLLSLLDQAMAKNRVPVALPIVESLGLRGDVRAARITPSGSPIGLVKALFLPNRRIQHEAVAAMLNLPTSPNPVAGTRVVDVLRRFTAMELKPKALIAFPAKDQAATVRSWVQAAGWEPVVAYNANDAVKALHATADFDVIFVLPSVSMRELPYAMAQFRQDADHGRLPLLLVTPKDREQELERFAAKYPFTWTIPEVYFKDAKQLKPLVVDAMTKAEGLPLTTKERAAMQRDALNFLWKMARGELTGYNVQPALDAIIDVLPSKDLAVQAIEILGRSPGLKPQQRLAEIVLDATRKEVHMTAITELNRHIQKYGLILNDRDIGRLETAAFRVPEKEAALRTAFAVLLARFNVDGARLNAGP